MRVKEKERKRKKKKEKGRKIERVTEKEGECCVFQVVNRCSPHTIFDGRSKALTTYIGRLALRSTLSSNMVYFKSYPLPQHFKQGLLVFG